MKGLIMKTYIGIKLLTAVAMSLGAYNTHRGWGIPSNEDPNREGYLVVYPDGYQSWSPKEQFEAAYLPLGDDGSRITTETVDSMIARITTTKIDDKTTLVKSEQVTGFTQYATSACVCPENYDEAVGKELAMKEIKNRLWFALGFVLQWAKYGLTHVEKEV